MEEAYEELEKISQNKKIIGLYDAEEVEKKIINTRLKSAKLEGIEEGKFEIAKNMLKKGMDISDIVEITGLSKETVEKLKA